MMESGKRDARLVLAGAEAAELLLPGQTWVNRRVQAVEYVDVSRPFRR
jgi:hypothetical protein